MGAKRVTPKEIVEMHRLYAELGTFAEVGRRMGRSGSTVAKYINLDKLPLALRLAVQNLMKTENEK